MSSPHIDPIDSSFNNHAQCELAAADERLLAFGYEPIPTIGKAPKNESWQTGEITVERIAAMRAALPAATNTGLRTALLPAIDVDFIDRQHVGRIMELAAEVLGPTPLRRVGSKGVMLPYRTETPTPKITITGTDAAGKVHKVEILGDGQQFVAYGIHPDTGHPYDWIDADWSGEEPLQMPRADLTEVTPDKLREFARRAAALLTELGYSDVRVSDRGNPDRAAAREQKRREDKVPVSREALIEILSFIDPGCDRTEWIGRLGSIQATNLRDVPAEAMDGELIEIAQAWSRGDYHGGRARGWAGDADVEVNYDTLKPDRLGGSTFGSLYHAARAAGYDKPPPQPTDEEKFGPGSQYEEYAKAQANGAGPIDDEVELICAAGASPKDYVWLMPDHYACGVLHVLAGKPEVGKNLIATSNAAIITTGGIWPDGTRAPLGDVIIWSGEEDFERTTLPRFLAAGGDPRRFYCVSDIKTVDGKRRPFDPARDVDRLCREMRKLPGLRYVIIDPISVVVAAGRGASNNNAEARRALQPLVNLAKERSVVVEGITHFAKDSGRRDVLERIIESTAFTAVARIVHVAHRFEEDTKARRWVRVKGNIVKRGGPVGFEYEPLEAVVPDYPDMRAPRLAWGEALRGNPRALLAEEQEPGAKDAAVAFLKHALIAAGPRGMEVTRELKPAAEAHGHSWAAIRRARDELPISPNQNLGAQHGGWRWIWNGPAEPTAEPW